MPADFISRVVTRVDALAPDLDDDNFVFALSDVCDETTQDKPRRRRTDRKVTTVVTLPIDGYTQSAKFSTIDRIDNISSELVTPISDRDETQNHKTGGTDARVPNFSPDPATTPLRLNRTRTLRNYRPSTCHRPRRISALLN